MITVTFQGFRDIEHAKAFASWYDSQGEQDSDEWLTECSVPTAYLKERPHITEDSIVLTIHSDLH
jgi:hypothetical protein